MKAIGALVCLGFLSVACAAAQEGPRAGNVKLYEAVASGATQQIEVIDSHSHSVERRLPLGAATADWKHLYSIVSSSLIDTDPQTGRTQGTMALGGAYQLPTVAANGLPGGLSANTEWLVVESFDGAATDMLVINNYWSRIQHRVHLQGRFHFDAVSDDGDRLYLIQYLNGKEYYVRLYDLAGGRLDENIVVDKSDGNQAMTGLRLSGVPAPDGSMLFSMYVRENESPFIHALNLSGPFAFCLDLPGGGYAQDKAATHWSLAMRSDGRRLYAINGATGVVAEVDTNNQYSPQVLRTARLDLTAGSATGTGAALLSRDGKTLVAAGGTGLLWVDPSTLRVRMRSLSDWRISSLEMSPDGGTIYAVAPNGLVAEVSMTSGRVITRFGPIDGDPLALMRVAAA
ncbi:MAG TPA: hypothetical protein VJQ08_02645 [Candidatus Dormibacteraeota bacterium]|nr:hypothetical protein [Candidatus Dormibacteraeota bacterium]